MIRHTKDRVKTVKIDSVMESKIKRECSRLAKKHNKKRITFMAFINHVLDLYFEELR